MTAWRKLTAAEQGRAIAQGEIDPRDLCEDYLSAIAAHPDADRIYARLTPDQARAEAEAAALRAKDGQRCGPLDGVPVSWKDLFDRAGVGTESGSALLKGRVPVESAEVVAAMQHAGVVSLGNTHMSELAFSGLGLNPVTATPPGLHDPDCVPGGSSSGAAASVAQGLAPLAIGSDTGGSVRIPAAWNDLVGLKTTHGRLSLKGVVPLVESFDSVGPLAKTVEDCALAFAALGGFPSVDLRDSQIEGLRFLVLENYTEDAREAPRRAFEESVARLQDAGAHIERRALACVDEALALSAPLFTPEAYATWQTEIEAAPDLMFDRILERFRSGREISGPEVMGAWRKLRALREAYQDATGGFDAVLLPTAPILPPNAKRLMEDEAYYVEENLLALRNTRVGNLMGLCGLSLPTGHPACGLMVLAAPHHDARLLRIGVALEAALA